MSILKSPFLLLAVIILAEFYNFGVQMNRYSLDLDQTILFRALDQDLLWDTIPMRGNLNSMGSYNPPMHAWIYWPLNLAVPNNPALVCMLTGLFFYTIAHALISYVTARYYDRLMALIVAVLFGFVGQAAYYATASWAQGLLPAMYAIFFSLAISWVSSRKSIYLILLIILTTFTAGLHLSAVLMLPLLGVLFLVYRIKISIKSLVVAGIVVLGIWFPYLYFQIQRDFYDVFNLIGIADAEPGISQAGFILFDLLQKVYLRFISVFYFNFCFPFSLGIFSSVVRIFLFILCMIGFVWSALFLMKTLRNKERSIFLEVLFISLICLLLLQNLTKFNPGVRWDIGTTYFIFSILPVAWLMHKLSGLNVKFLRWGISGMVCAVLLVQVIGVGAQRKYQFYDWRSHIMMHVATDMDKNRNQEATIQYDLDARSDNWESWIVDYNEIDPDYYVGSAFDYYLEFVWGKKRTGKTANGMVENADYVVAYKKNLSEDSYEGTTGYETVYVHGTGPNSIHLLAKR